AADPLSSERLATVGVYERVWCERAMSFSPGAGENYIVTPVHTVLVIDNDNAYRAALTEALAVAPDLRLVAAASNVKDGLALATTLRPDLVIVDVRMPDGGGPVVARQLSRHMPNLAILA